MSGSKVWVVGGGLAGMVVAKELSERLPRGSVTILEESDRLGGKAGADRRGDDWIDHGYHVFPGWYANTRKLLREIDALKNLVDIHETHYIFVDENDGSANQPPGDQKRVVTIKDHPPNLTGVRNFIHNVFDGFASWREMLLLMYALFDLANEPFRYTSFLDQTTTNAFLASRLLSTENVAEIGQFSVLQGSSIPSYELSAVTLQRIMRAWTRSLTPLFSIMNGNLQQKFIEPFRQALAERGVAIETGKTVKRIVLTRGRATSVVLSDDTVRGGNGDVFVVAVPHGRAVELVSPELYLVEEHYVEPSGSEENPPPRFSDFHKLRSAPMAAMHLTLSKKPRMPDGRPLPDEHVILHDSRYLTSFVNIAPHWGLKQPTLSVIVSNFELLECLATTPDVNCGLISLRDEIPAPVKCVLDEMKRFLLDFDTDTVVRERSYVRFNVTTPLFLNIVGAWNYRPKAKTRIEKLYVAGDYCRTEVDLTTMESAVTSGLTTAKRILEDNPAAIKEGSSEVVVESLKTDEGFDFRTSYPRIPLRLVQWGLSPMMIILYYSLLPSRRSGELFWDTLYQITGWPKPKQYVPTRF